MATNTMFSDNYQSGNQSIDYILDRLKSLGIDTGFTPGLQASYDPLQGISNISGTDISTGLRELFGIGSKIDMPGSMFETLDPRLVQALGNKFYEPMKEESYHTNLGDYKKATQKAGQINRGFYKTSRRDRYKQEVYDVFGKKLAETQADINKRKLQAEQTLGQQITEWKKAAQSLRFA